MPFDCGDIVLVPFPFTNQTASKRRPAVVVSCRRYNMDGPDIIMMAVTSQFRPSPNFGEVWVGGWRQAGLLKPSAIKPVFATIEQRLVLRHLGTLDAQDQSALKNVIAQIIC